MRLIDADALWNALNDAGGTGAEHGSWADGWDKAIDEAICLVEKAPAVEPAQQWIPVTERLPENAAHLGAFCPRHMVMTKYGVTEGWYNPDKESWFILFWFMTERLLEHEISFGSGDVPRMLKVPIHTGVVTAWMPLPKPYKEEMNR